MKHIKLLIASAVFVLTFLVCTLLFYASNMVMHGYIKNMAEDIILHTIKNDIYYNYNGESYEEAGYSLYPEIFAVDSEYNAINDDKNINYNFYRDNYYFYAETDKKIVDWCRKNTEKDKIIRVLAGSSKYYVYQSVGKLVKKEDFYDTVPPDSSEEGISVIWIIYVDVTSEELIINKVNSVLIFVMLFCTVTAGFLGIIIGRAVEFNQKRQKEFFENASHELKTPLMSIQGYAEGIETGVVNDVPKAAAVIINESTKMAALVDEILSLSRLESGALHIKIQELSLREVIYDCLYALEAEFAKKGIALEEDIKDVFINADLKQFETVVVNILSNTLRHADKSVKITADEERLVIYNDGESISDEDIKHVFERFYAGKKGSTGIGMALTKEIIKKHGWHITVKGIADGTQFIIYFNKKLQKGSFPN